MMPRPQVLIKPRQILKNRNLNSIRQVIKKIIMLVSKRSTEIRTKAEQKGKRKQPAEKNQMDSRKECLQGRQVPMTR